MHWPLAQISNFRMFADYGVPQNRDAMIFSLRLATAYEPLRSIRIDSVHVVSHQCVVVENARQNAKQHNIVHMFAYNALKVKDAKSWRLHFYSSEQRDNFPNAVSKNVK